MSQPRSSDDPELTHVSPHEQPPDFAEFAVVTFYPQIWHDNRAVTSDDTEQFEVPINKATDDGGHLLKDCTSATDQLRHCENAPERAQNWYGPFYVEIDGVY